MFGGQFYSRIPKELKKEGINNIFLNVIKINTIKSSDKEIFISTDDKFISIDTESILPVIIHLTDPLNEKMLSQKFDLELNSVQEIKM